MRIAHFSDPHVLSMLGVALRRFFGKRATGSVHLFYQRGRRYRPEHVRAILRHIAEGGYDHVVLTGDITNLALEPEFERALALLSDELGLPPERVSVIPGNHDAYTAGSFHGRRHRGYFDAYATSDLPALAVDLQTGHFPFVRLRGAAAIIGLSSAVPQLPFVAAGRVGSAQLEALGRVLAHPEVTRRTPVVLVHHPAQNPRSPLMEVLDGLEDRAALLDVLGAARMGVVLHGHLHVRAQRLLPVRRGAWLQVGATSAALDDEDLACRAAYNVIEIDDEGAVAEPYSMVLGQRGAPWLRLPIPWAPPEPSLVDRESFSGRPA